MTRTIDSKSVSDAQRERPGAYLRSVRQRKRISRDYLQQQLGLTNRLFDALENDDFARLPGPVYVRGYLRRYAELAGERVAPVLAAYQDRLVEEGLASAPRSEEPPPQRPYLVMATSALAMLLATSLVFGAILSDSQDFAEEEVAPVEVAAVVDALAPVSPAREGVAAAEQTLDLAFITDSWVEVVDARDHILAVSLQREGTNLRLEGEPPFAVTLGYGPGVAVSYLGEQVSFEHDPETFSSKFVIGK